MLCGLLSGTQTPEDVTRCKETPTGAVSECYQIKSPHFTALGAHFLNKLFNCRLWFKWKGLITLVKDSEIIRDGMWTRSTLMVLQYLEWSHLVLLIWSKHGSSGVKFRDTDLLTVRSSVQILEQAEGVNGKHTNSSFIYNTPNLHLLKRSWSVDSMFGCKRQLFSECLLESI